MTPAQVETAARRRYNSENSTFWSQDEVFKVIWEGEQILAKECLCIEGKDTSITTVNGTRTYAMPSLYIGVKRMEWNGIKLQRIDDRQDDLLTLMNSTDTSTGNPQFYWIWNDTIYLRLIPGSAQTLTIYGYKEATLLTTASSTLSVPVICHQALINYTASIMAAKDEKWDAADRYEAKWESDVLKLKAWFKKRRRTDAFSVVKDADSFAETIIGNL